MDEETEPQEKQVRLTLQSANTRQSVGSRHVRKGILLAIVAVLFVLWLLANYSH
jgi:hypothetical protein